MHSSQKAKQANSDATAFELCNKDLASYKIQTQKPKKLLCVKQTDPYGISKKLSFQDFQDGLVS